MTGKIKLLFKINIISMFQGRGGKLEDKIEEDIVLKRALTHTITIKMKGSERTNENTNPAHP